MGLEDSGAGPLTVRALFATLTNVNFDPERIAALVRECAARRDALREGILRAGGAPPDGKVFSFAPADSLEGLVRQGEGSASRLWRAWIRTSAPCGSF